jgi:metalloproteinase inhibitor 3
MRADVVVLTLAVAVMLAFLQYSNACSCMPSHLQTQYCNADFVILAMVKRERTLNETRVYKVRVRKEYKLSDTAQVALKYGRLLTPVQDSMCGVVLQLNQMYAISGRVNSLKAHVYTCDMVVPWKDLTRRQRKGLKAIYKNGCDCKINHCRYRSCRKTPDVCLWTSDCHAKEGICLRQNSNKCKWTRNRALASCLKPSPLTISRWSG